MTSYFDCNSTTPVEPVVAELVRRYLEEEFGNSGSRTHEFGSRAKAAVAKARGQVAGLVDSDPSEVVFTSGATESNNIAILGLEKTLEAQGRTHVLTTAVEHKAVLEPLERLAERGFEVEHVTPDEEGRISANDFAERLRPETGLVSSMHVNNETGVIHPIQEIADVLDGHQAFFHVDAAQGFGKVSGLESSRIDLISISGHKVYAPKGVGALITRRRGVERAPLTPIMVGGGQERGLRPGTVPVHLVVGLGEAARLAKEERNSRAERCGEIRTELMTAFDGFDFSVNGAPDQVVVSTLNISLHGVDAEAAIVCLKGVVAVSNGAACTSSSYSTSHVLEAMGLPEDRIRGSLRWSWSHLTEDPPVAKIRRALAVLGI